MPSGPKELAEHGLEFAEPDLTADLPAALTTERTSRARWLTLVGIVIVVLVGLSLFPPAPPEADPVDLALPKPGVVTTVVGSQVRLLATVSAESNILWVVSGLRGFVSLTEPVAFLDSFWIVGNRPDDTEAAIVLSSADGRIWREVSRFTPPIGDSIRVDQLALVDGSLVAVGAQGRGVGPSFYRTIAGNVLLWRSLDGVRWIPEIVYEHDDPLGIRFARLAASGETAILQVFAQDLRLAEAVSELPNDLTSAVEHGTFYFVENQGLVLGPLGIELYEARPPAASQESSLRLFRSNGSTPWAELDVGFDFDSLLTAGDGFIAITRGFARTSIDGITWTSYPHDAPSFYQQFDGDLLGITYDVDGLSLEIIGTNGSRAIQLPNELERCGVKASNGTLAARCQAAAPLTPQAVQWESDWLVFNQSGGFDLVDSSGVTSRRFPTAGATGTYDPENDTISLLDTEGIAQAFPVDLLDQILPRETSFSHDVMVSGDGLIWTPSKLSLAAWDVQLLGGVKDGFLVASGSHEPNATLTVLVAEG